MRIFLGKLLHFFLRPAHPRLPNGELRLHLGCGKIDHPGFVNIDALPRRNVHYVQAVDRLGRFHDNSVDLVYACHVLDHFSHLQVPAVLKKWGRVLKPGGKLCLSVPDFDRLLDIYRDNSSDAEIILNALMGGRSTPTTSTGRSSRTTISENYCCKRVFAGCAHGLRTTAVPVTMSTTGHAGRCWSMVGPIRSA